MSYAVKSCGFTVIRVEVQNSHKKGKTKSPENIYGELEGNVSFNEE